VKFKRKWPHKKKTKEGGKRKEKKSGRRGLGGKGKEKKKSWGLAARGVDDGKVAGYG